jgi:hypothetical protein
MSTPFLIIGKQAGKEIEQFLRVPKFHISNLNLVFLRSRTAPQALEPCGLDGDELRRERRLEIIARR